MKARQIELQGVADVLGVQAVALKEVMKEFKGSTYVGGFPKFLETLFAKTADGSDNRPALAGTPNEPTYALAAADDQPLLPPEEPQLEHVVHKCPKCGHSVTVEINRAGPERHFACPSCGASLRTGAHQGSHVD